MKHARVEVTKDRVNEVVRAVGQLVRKEVLVGIPSSTAGRRNESQPINNAELGYIHEFGAPGANIPPRPFLIPGVRKSAPDYVPHLRSAAKASLDGNAQRADKSLVAAGVVAEMAVKQEIHSGNFAPLKPATIAARRRSRQTQSRRPEEERYAELVRAGMSPAAAQTETGIRPLINTGQLAAAITSVVRAAK